MGTLSSFHSTLTLDLWLRLLFSLTVGFVGSIAYVSILYFRFIGRNNHDRSLILGPFLKNNGVNFWKLMWYCLIGGAIAAIFQYPESNFVPVQSFLLGVSWPSIVSQHISGRMKDPTEDEIKEYSKPVATDKQWDEVKTELDDILRDLKGE